MSQRAILLAVRDRLRQPPADGGLGYQPKECAVMFDGQPPPWAGERFVAVWAGPWVGHDLEGLEEEFGIFVTVSMRAARIPPDRLGESLIAGPPGQSLDEVLRAIVAKLHMDPGPIAVGNPGQYPVLALANATIGAGENGFVEPLRFKDGGRPEEKGPEWWWAEPAQGAPAGIVQTLTFGGARRVQVIEEQS